MTNSNYIYYYPAIFKEAEAGYNVSFIDFDFGTFGSNLVDAMEIAQKTLESLVFEILKSSNLSDLPEPTQCFKNYNLKEDEAILLIRIDIMEYLKKHSSMSVRKNLTIPSWLNALAEENNVNFSQILQAALKKELGIN